MVCCNSSQPGVFSTFLFSDVRIESCMAYAASHHNPICAELPIRSRTCITRSSPAICCYGALFLPTSRRKISSCAPRHVCNTLCDMIYTDYWQKVHAALFTGSCQNWRRIALIDPIGAFDIRHSITPRNSFRI